MSIDVTKSRSRMGLLNTLLGEYLPLIGHAIAQKMRGGLPSLEELPHFRVIPEKEISTPNSDVDGHGKPETQGLVPERESVGQLCHINPGHK